MPTTDIEVCPQVHDAETSTNIDAAKNDQYTGFRRVAGPIPWLLFLICVVEFGERFVYFGVSAPLQNYIQHPYPFDPETGIPGALDKGQAVGAALGNLLKFWSYLCTVLGAIVADQWLGKFKTILASSPIYIAGMVLLVATATPVAINSGASFGGLIASIILIGLGTGGLKACIAPLCGEQNTETGERFTTLKTGEVVVIDAKLTTARIFLWYYWAANIGCLSALITVAVEKAASFWLAYLIPLIVFMLVLTVFVVFSKKVNKLPPQGSPILDASNAIKIALKEKSFEKAKPSVLRSNQRLELYAFAQSASYTDTYVEQVKSGLLACKYFLLFPFFTVCWTQIFNNLISQAGAMDLGSTPNDLMQNLSTVFMLAFIPLLDLVVYPALRKAGIDFNPVRRITLGFFCASLSMVYACVVQHFIYNSPPSSINVWVQTPGYVFGSLAEIWVLVTGIEIAFNNAPENLRAVVTSVFWVTIAVGAAISIALSPVSQDPYMVWTYGGIAVAAFIAGCVFWVCFRNTARENPVINGLDLATQISHDTTRGDDEVSVKVSKT